MKQVTYAKLHGTDAFVPGFGNIGTTLDGVGGNVGGKRVELGLWYSTLGLEFSIGHNGKLYQGVFPHANVQLAVFTNDTNVTPLSPKNIA